MKESGIGRLDKCASDFCTGSSHGLFVREKLARCHDVKPRGKPPGMRAFSVRFTIGGYRLHRRGNMTGTSGFEERGKFGSASTIQPTLWPVLESKSVP